MKGGVGIVTDAGAIFGAALALAVGVGKDDPIESAFERA